MTDHGGRPAGTWRIGGDMAVHRLGFGAMRITGQGVWGPPADRGEALRLLRLLPELGVDFIDTADSYGPDVSEQLIREALHPYRGLVIATKGGLRRGGPGQWTPDGRPEYLLGQLKGSLHKLGVERIDLWQLHRIDPKVGRDEQFDAVRRMIEQGLVRHAGLSEVGIDDIEAARGFFPVATVQNRYNLGDRGSEPVLEYCERHGIGFIPWYPLAAGSLARPGSPLEQAARRHRASAGQVALAWLLQRSPVMLPIPGTARVEHLRQNMAAATLRLSREEFADIERAAGAA